MKYSTANHIIGKVYDLTQENMNAMLEDIDRLRAELGAAKDTLRHIRDNPTSDSTGIINRTNAWTEWAKQVADEVLRTT